MLSFAPMPYFEKHVFICNNERPADSPRGDCTRKGGKEVREKFKDELASRGLKGRMRANTAGCLDNCEQGCSVVVYPDDVWYGHVTPADVTEIVEKHLLGGKPVERLVIPRKK
jgi:(2Fe-2S) ferredoxin